MERAQQHLPLHRLSSRSNWLKKAPHKDPLRLRNLCMEQLTTSVSNAVNFSDAKISQDFHQMCLMLKTTLPLELRTLVVQEVSASQEVSNHMTCTRLLLLHLLTDVQHISLITALTSGSWLEFTEEQCTQLLEELGSVSRFSLLSLHLEGVIFAKGFLSEIIHRSTRLTSIHVSGDDAASEVLAFIVKNPRGLHTLHLDDCSVNDFDVVHALVKSYKEIDSWTDIDVNDIDDTDIDDDFPPLCHLSIQSPLLTVCGALVLLHSLRNLKTLQYSYWNTSICNLLQYLQQQSLKSSTFGLTSISLWRVSEKSLDTLKLCPNLQHLMMECIDPSLESMDALAQLSKLNSLTFRLVPEELIISAVKAVGKQLIHLDIEFEEYARTPIKWGTIQAIQQHSPYLKRLELHHINIKTESGDILAPLRAPTFVDLVHLNLSSVVLQSTLLIRMLCKNVSLESLVLDVNQEALTDAVVMALVKNNSFSLLSDIYLTTGMVSARTLTFLMTLPSMAKISVQLSRFPLIPATTFLSTKKQISKGNYRCMLENDEKEE